MRKLCPHFSIAICVVLSFANTAGAQSANQIKAIKLLTSEIGWAATDHKLFWTTDNGANWKDITPKLNHKHQMVSSVFFLDTSTGWALLNCGDDRDPIADDVCFEFALTSDSGESWTIVHPKIVDPVPPTTITEDGQGFSGTAYLGFADAQHGWAILARNLPVGRSSGEMLRTVDGGHTWTQLAKGKLPMADGFVFVNSQDGWITGAPDGELYVTHNAGDSWQKVSLPKPQGVGPDTGVEYGLPTFESGSKGFVSVRYAVGPVTGPDLSTLVLFATDDGGGTWKQHGILSRIPNVYSSDLVDSVLVCAHSEQKNEPPNDAQQPTTRTTVSLYALDRDRTVINNTAEVPSQGAATELSFVGRDQGWTNLSGRVFATRDAGRTWVEITPGGAPVSPPPSVKGRSKVVQLKDDSAERMPWTQSPSSGNVSTHLGFDGYNVPSLTQMSAWMTSSPFYDIYIYLPGSPNRHNDPILSSSQGSTWVSSVEGQGWGIAPIWFGLQSSCIIGQPNVTQYFGPTTADASTQGAQQADLAVAADQALGITSGIIFTDIESYTVNSTCSPLVQAYVDGFVSEIHVYSGYLAGVYANAGPINHDISNKNVAQPDVIWITKVPPKTAPIPSVAVWNQGIKDTLWPNNQRMHQFLFNYNAKSAPNATWGGVPLSIDYDIDNGPVVNPNAIAKSYTYTAATIDCAGAISTIPTAMNDMNNGAIINGPGQMGSVVGVYQTSLTSPQYPFQNSGGTCTTLNVLGAQVVEPWGINNLGQIVGYFEDSNGAYHGFLLTPGQNPIQIDYPGGGQTYLYGINDAGQAMGWNYSAATGYQTFMYYGSHYYPLGITGGGNFDYTLGYGINGDAVLTGKYYFQPFNDDFELAAIPSLNGNTVTWGGTVIDLTPGGSSNTVAKGINANDELAGFYFSSACGNTQAECGFEWSGGFLITILAHGTDASAIEGMNDFAEAVGPYTDSVTGYSHGLLWTHQ